MADSTVRSILFRKARKNFDSFHLNYESKALRKIIDGASDSP